MRKDVLVMPAALYLVCGLALVLLLPVAVCIALFRVRQVRALIALGSLLGFSVGLLHLLWRFVVWSLHRAFDGVLK